MQNQFRTCLIFLTGLLIASCAPSTATPPSPHVQPQLPTSTAPTQPSISSPVWTAQLSDAVNTAPFISGDLVIVATANGVIQAVHADSGEIAWEFSSETKVWDASVNGDETRVCAGMMGGLVTCLDSLTGEPIWTVEIGQEVQSSIALTPDRIYAPTTLAGPGLTNDYGGQASLFSLDAVTGEIVWNAITDNYILRSPVVNGEVILTGGAYQVDKQTPEKINSRIYALSVIDGSVLWKYESNDGLVRWVASKGDVVTFSAATETVHTLSLSDGQPIWNFGPGYWMQYPVLHDGQIYFGSGDEVFQALDASSGELIWQHSISMSSLNQMGLPLLRDEQIWFNSVTGEIYALDVKTGEQVQYLFTGRTARIGGALYQNLYILGDPDGKLSAYQIQ